MTGEKMSSKKEPLKHGGKSFMTDKALFVLLSSIESDLWKVYEQIVALMPEDAEREIITETRLKPEWKDKLIFTLEVAMNESKYCETIERKADYIALQPLSEWLSQFKDTISALLDQEDKL